MQPVRRVLALCAGAVLLLASAAKADQAANSRPSPPPDSFARLQQFFVNPPIEYRSAPLFGFNGEVTESEIRLHLSDLAAQGIGGVFIHPRPGLVTEYLSKRWFELCRFTLEEARKLGMRVWMYDENSWPSGFAGGHVPAEMPEAYNGGQGLRLRKLDRLAAGETEKCHILMKKSGAAFQTVQEPRRESDQAGEYYCFEVVYFQKSNYYGGWSYVDLLRPGVTDKFIELTMPGYERVFGSEFGKRVPGIFTDEPRTTPPIRQSCIRWTPDMFEQFQRRWGYDVRPHFASLFEETGDWKKVRHNYYSTLLELFIERWSKPWFRYTEAKKLSWTGHYWEHDWPSPMHGVDNMAMYAWHQVPGIDMLFNQFNENVDAQFGNVRSVKELRSIANQMGRRRTLSETYAGSGWELRFEDMKRLGDWQAVLGVNLLCQHMVQMTVAGARKYDFPQSFSYHEPWWKHYRVLGDYFARLSFALSTGEQVNRILVVEPTTSAWMHASATAISPTMMELGRSFQGFVTRLEHMQCEYDLGSENVIKEHGKAAAGRFVIGHRSYDLVILPPGTENLDSATAKLLNDYVRQGGTVLAFVDPPDRVDGDASDTLKRLSQQHPGRWLHAVSLDDPMVKEKLATADFEPVAGKLFHQRRQLADGQLLFFANSSLEKPAKWNVAVGGPVRRLNLETGAVAEYPARRSNGRSVVSVDLAPGGSLLLAVTKSKATAGARAERAGEERVVPPTAPVTVQPLSPNVLTIDYCDLNLGGAVEKDVYFYTASEKAFQHNGLTTNPWTTVQYRTTALDKNHFPADSGFEAVFHFDVAEGVATSGMQVVIERPGLWHVSVNGTPVQNRPKTWWLDRSFGVYDIGAHVVPGTNEISVRAQPMSVHNELERIFVLGAFGLKPQERGWRVVPNSSMTAGAWKNQGLPFYSQEVAYGGGYVLRPATAGYKVRLGKWNGTVAEVRVNGKHAGIIASQPYEFDISRFAQNGENRIEVVVVGSLKNLLGPHHGKIDRGLVSPLSFRTAPERMPAGQQYDLDAYGLFESFQVLESSEKHR